MISRHSSPTRNLLPLLVVAVAAACQDAPSTAPVVPRPDFDISEARFGDGNEDFFFGTPLAANASTADPEFDEGASNDALVPYVRICLTDGVESPDGCTGDVTGDVTGSATGLRMRYNAGSEQYRVTWRTNRLNREEDYRIEIWGAAFTEADRDDFEAEAFGAGHPLAGQSRWLFGWRDISFSPNQANCTGEEEFCQIRYGQRLPIRVRIEDHVFCPVDQDCATQFVASGSDATLEAFLGQGQQGNQTAQLFIPGQQTDFPLAFEPCSAGELAAVEAFSALPTFGPCLRTVAPPNQGNGGLVVLDDPATLSLCFDIDDLGIDQQLAVPGTQHDHVGIHHFSTAGDQDPDIDFVEAWPHTASACEEPTSGGSFASAESPRGFLQLAQAAGKRVLSLFGPERLVALDKGGGGQGFKLGSFYRLALPTLLDYEVAGDGSQLAPAGSDVALRAKAKDLDGNPVWGARVGWSVQGGGGAVLSASEDETGADGIAEVTVTLPPEEVLTVVHATGLGLADDREVGCTLFGQAGGAAACNGPRAGFDPFQPDGPASPGGGGVVEIPEGTRLVFSIQGCVPGQPPPLQCK